MVKMKKSMALFISFIVTIIFIPLLSILLNPLFNKLSEDIIMNIASPILLSIGLLFFMLFQGALKYIWNKKALNNSKTFLEIKISNFTYSEKSWLYILLAIIYFAPFISSHSLKGLSVGKIIPFIIFVIIIYFLLKLSESSMKIIFTTEGIIITGLDLRIDISLGQPLRNATGYYPYTMIDSYLPLENGIELFIQYEQGKVTAITDKDTVNKILGILKTNKIEIRKF